MTRQEYKRIRESLGLTQGQLAKSTGLRLNTISRRERGELPITKEAALALRFLQSERSKNLKRRT